MVIPYSDDFHILHESNLDRKLIVKKRTIIPASLHRIKHKNNITKMNQCNLPSNPSSCDRSDVFIAPKKRESIVIKRHIRCVNLALTHTLARLLFIFPHFKKVLYRAAGKDYRNQPCRDCSTVCMLLKVRVNSVYRTQMEACLVRTL